MSFSLCCISIPASLSSYSTSSRTITLPYTSSHYSIIVEGSANKVDNLIQVGMKSLKKYLNLTTASKFLSRWRRFTPVLRGLFRFPLLICNWAMQQYYIFCHLQLFLPQKICCQGGRTTQFTAPKLSLFSSASKPHLSCTTYITSILVKNKNNQHQIIIQ